MGKRKKATKPPPKPKAPKLEKIFDCPWCKREKTVDYTVRNAATEGRIGKVECRECRESHSVPVNPLEEAVDVYHDWLDRIVEVNQEDE